MSDILKAAFIFVAPDADPATHRQWVKTPKVHLLAIGVKDYAGAVDAAQKIVAQDGVMAIELCGGFGARGTAMVAEAVGAEIPVGVVRFDIHPGLGNASGDTLF